MIKTDDYILFNNCEAHVNAIERAYQLIKNNYDILESWFEETGRSGKVFAKHFDGRTRTRFKCKNFKNLYGRGLPTGMELGEKYLNNLASAGSSATANQNTCLDIDLAAVIIHETYHLCWKSGEKKAWSMEAWWRVKVTERLGLEGTLYCNVSEFPADGIWNIKLSDIKAKVRAAVHAS